MSDLRLATLLCTRLCHDLVGPIGAVSNGLELIDDSSGSMGDDVIELVRNSAGESANRLKFFRAAYGLSGGSVGGLDDLQRMATAYFSGGRVRFTGLESTSPGSEAPVAGQVQIIFNLVLCAVEALPRGGEVGIRWGPANGVLRVGVTIRGTVVELGETIRRGLSGDEDIATLEPRRIQPYFTWRLLADAGANIRIEQESPESAEIVAEFP